MSLTENERDVMQHALGLTRSHESYRNYFAAEPGTPDDATWASLALCGLAILRPKSEHDKHFNIYHVTPAGRAALSPVMSDRPIIFSAPMVLALLDGRKTMTRRLAWRTRWNEGGHIPDGAGGQMDYVEPFEERIGPSPWQKAAPGDRLWVREGWQTELRYDWTKAADMPDRFPVYFQTEPEVGCAGKSRPSIHMPRWASRLTLIVKAVKVERLQDISEADAIAEGARRFDDIPLDPLHRRYPAQADRWSMETPTTTGQSLGSARNAFGNLWEKLHGPRAWDANPEVVAISFKVVKANIDANQPPATSTADNGSTGRQPEPQTTPDIPEKS